MLTSNNRYTIISIKQILNLLIETSMLMVAQASRWWCESGSENRLNRTHEEVPGNSSIGTRLKTVIMKEMKQLL